MSELSLLNSVEAKRDARIHGPSGALSYGESGAPRKRPVEPRRVRIPNEQLSTRSAARRVAPKIEPASQLDSHIAIAHVSREWIVARDVDRREAGERREWRRTPRDRSTGASHTTRLRRLAIRLMLRARLI